MPPPPELHVHVGVVSLVGVVAETVGALGGALSQVTVIESVPLVFPAASRAVTPKVLGPACKLPE